MSSCRCPERAFTLVEVAVALLVVGLLVGALALPLATQLQARRYDAARRQLEAAGDALLGFAAANGRLPCPATEASRGEEAFAAAGDAGNGECARFYDGFLPAAALGLAGVDAAGLVRDPWEAEGNRVRYAVAGTSVNGIARPFTRRGGMRAATLQGLSDASHFLFVCTTGEGATASGCATAAQQLTRKAAFVVLSTGPNAGADPHGDEARNLSGSPVFVAHDPTAPGPGEFDDVVHWGGLPMLVHRLLAAGQLP